jgi:Uma2 family endonuclease
MTVVSARGRLLTIADYEALPEDELQRWELLEGNLVMAPSPTPHHNLVVARLHAELDAHVPGAFIAVPDIDLNLELAPHDAPATVRRPDLVVVTRAEYMRVDREGGLLRASAAALVVEVVSLGSRRTDLLIKRGEYADAGIPHYWIIDADAPTSLIACHLAGTFGYQDRGEVRGVFGSDEPFSIRVDLDALV